MGRRKPWTIEEIRFEAKTLADDLGYFPSSSFFREAGRNDLCAAISKKYDGGFHKLAIDIGHKPFDSDTLTGWKGEKQAKSILSAKGYNCELTKCKCPYDILIDNLLRVDIKTAKYAIYGASKGWFYRIGKEPQADIVVLLRSDENDLFILPWFICPKTNITLSKDFGVHKSYHNNYDVIDEMLKNRVLEKKLFPCFK